MIAMVIVSIVEKYFELDDLTRVANDDLVCDDCLDANYAQCSC